MILKETDLTASGYLKKFETGPTGRIIIGNVLDSNKKEIEKALKRYDEQLYLKWNPKKLKGWGCWEVRRRPNTKSVVYQGGNLFTVEYKEMDLVHHVLDCAYINHKVLEKIKSMDTFIVDRWADKLDAAASAGKEAEEKKQRDELRYSIKQHKKQWRDFADFVSQGGNPGKVLAGKWF